MSIKINKSAGSLEKFLTYYQQKAKAIVEGTAIYLTRNPYSTPPAFFLNLEHNHVLHNHIYIVSILFDRVPYVNLLDNVSIEKFDEHVTLIIIHYGYMDETNIPAALQSLKEKGAHIDLENATYFLGRESIEITKHTGMSPFRETVFDFLGRNSTRITRYFALPSDKVFEIGSRIRL